MAVHIPLNLAPKEAKVIKVREALSWLKHIQMTKVLVEMDSQVVFNALNRPSLTSSPFTMLVKDCQGLAKSMSNIIFTFAKRFAMLTLWLEQHVLYQIKLYGIFKLLCFYSLA